MSLWFSNVELNNNLVAGINYTNKQLEGIIKKQANTEQRINKVLGIVEEKVEGKDKEIVEETVEEKKQFVKIENHKSPDEVVLMNINKIDRVEVKTVGLEPLPPITPDNNLMIGQEFLLNLRETIIEENKFIHERDIAVFLDIDSEPDMYRSMAIRGYTLKMANKFAPAYIKYRLLVDKMSCYKKEMKEFEIRKNLAPVDDEFNIYMLWLKKEPKPLYTTKQTFYTLNRILCEDD